MLLSGDKTMTPWQAVWYILGALLYPVGFAVLTLGLMNLGIGTDIAYLAGVFGLPIIWLPLNHYLMRTAYEREGKIGPVSANAAKSSLLFEPEQKRPLIR